MFSVQKLSIQSRDTEKYLQKAVATSKHILPGIALKMLLVQGKMKHLRGCVATANKQTGLRSVIVSNIRHEDFWTLSVRSFVTLRLPPLDFETGWT